MEDKIWIESSPPFVFDWDMYRLTSEEEEKLQEGLRGRKWEKYVRRFKHMVTELAWCDEVARVVSEESGVEVKLDIPEPFHEYTCFYSVFDARGMSEDEKLEEIKRRGRPLRAP